MDNPHMRKPCTIEIFAGTGSFSKVARVMFPSSECITVDIDERFGCTHTCDISAFDYKTLIPPSKYFVTHVWMPPPCTMYSVCRTRAKKPRDLVGADALVSKGLEIIRFYQENSNRSLKYFIENPGGGMLKTRDIMRPYTNHFDVNYCRYAPWGMRKLTRIWTNIDKGAFVPKRCLGARFCSECIPSPHCEGRYVHRCTPTGSFNKKGKWKSVKLKAIDLAQVPPSLIRDLLLSTFVSE